MAAVHSSQMPVTQIAELDVTVDGGDVFFRNAEAQGCASAELENGPHMLGVENTGDLGGLCSIQYDDRVLFETYLEPGRRTSVDFRVQGDGLITVHLAMPERTATFVGLVNYEPARCHGNW